MKIGIDLVKECRAIENHALKTAAGSKLASTYENMVKITAPRDGFIRLSQEEYGDIAINHVGLGTGAKLVRYENPKTGIKEHILACSRFVQRMLFDKENKSIGTIAFDNSSYPAREGISYKVLVPDEKGHTMEILPDGTKKLLKDNKKYDEAYGINAYGVMIKDAAGYYISKFFGK